MPADNSLSDKPSKHHGDPSKPYTCYEKGHSISAWGIDYGYCRTSLDVWPEHSKQGSSDPRCPADCRGKAPLPVAQEFQRIYVSKGNAAAAEYTKAHKAEQAAACKE